MWSEFLAGYLAGCFSIVGAVVVLAACAAGGRYDDASDQYDPERP